MSFKEAEFNTTKQIKGGNLITGSRDAVFLRNRFQTEVDNANAAFVNMIHHVEDDERFKITRFIHQAEKLEKDILAHTDERKRLYDSLDELLKKELGQEYIMFNLNPQGVNIKATELGTSVHIGGLGSTGIVNTAPLKYLEKYPELQAKASFATILHKIEEKEIRIAVQNFNQEVAIFKSTLPSLETDLKKCEDKQKAYFKLLEEWNEKRKLARYFNSFWFKILPEDKKASLIPDTITHRIEQFTNTLNIFQSELIQWKNHKFMQGLQNGINHN